MATKSKLTRIEKRKRLSALFERGDYVRLGRDDDGRAVVNPEVESEDDIKIWVGPPSPLQREMAVREAQANRARTMIEARDNLDSATSVTITNYVRGLTTDSLVEYLTDLDEQDYLSQARRDVLGRKEWEDFNALRDAMRQFEEAGSPQDDPEWAPLMEKDRAFGTSVLERALEIKDDARSGYKMMPRPRLEELAIEKRVEQAGSMAFMEQYEEWMLFYACRDDENHSELWFESLDELKSQPDEVQAALASKLASFIQDSTEAKN